MGVEDACECGCVHNNVYVCQSIAHKLHRVLCNGLFVCECVYVCMYVHVPVCVCMCVTGLVYDSSNNSFLFHDWWIEQ